MCFIVLNNALEIFRILETYAGSRCTQPASHFLLGSTHYSAVVAFINSIQANEASSAIPRASTGLLLALFIKQKPAISTPFLNRLFQEYKDLFPA